MDPAQHAWADARFATDIMAEHALFFALLMPEELAPKERAEALRFHETFSALFERIDRAAAARSVATSRRLSRVTEAIKPFIEYKARLGEAQT